jgi:hypothetical protein
MRQTLLALCGLLLLAVVKTGGSLRAEENAPAAAPAGYEGELLIPLGQTPPDGDAGQAAAPAPAAAAPAQPSETSATAAPEASSAAVPSPQQALSNERLFEEIAAMNVPPGERVMPDPSAVAASLAGPAFLPSPAAGPSAPKDVFRLRAAQRVLSPTLQDGYNDQAVFGADAAEVIIVDINGRRVFQARRESSRDGIIRWDGRNPAGKVVDSGTYFARIYTPDGRSVNQNFIVVR